MLKCCLYFGAILALLFSLLVTFGRKDDFLVGFSPFLVNEHRITKTTIPNLEGKIMIVTGANAGLGKDTVKHLAVNGAKVIMGCRSMSRCESAKQSIVTEIEAGLLVSEDTGIDYSKFVISNLVPMELDLSSFESIKKFGIDFQAENSALHSLILNAGVMHTPYGLTIDGIEQQLGINHFGHFYLTKLLLPLIEESEPSTIVSVSSVAHRMSYPEGVRVTLDDINNEETYDPIAAYGQSKLANILFAQELAQKMEAKQKQVYVNALHPGFVNSELARHYNDVFVKGYKLLVESFPNTICFESDEAALLEVYVAASPEIFQKRISGKYFVQLGEEVNTHPQAKIKDLQKGLWALSEEIITQKGF